MEASQAILEACFRYGKLLYGFLERDRRSAHAIEKEPTTTISRNIPKRRKAEIFIAYLPDGHFDAVPDCLVDEIYKVSTIAGAGPLYQVTDHDIDVRRRGMQILGELLVAGPVCQ